MFENNLLAGVSGQGGAYSIEDSLRFNDDDSAYLSRTLTTPTSATKWTWSAWVKRGNIGSNQMLFTAGVDVDDYDYILLGSSNQLLVYHGVGGSTGGYVYTNAVLRDTSGWYHIVVKFDGSLSSSNRVTIYVNGVAQTITVSTAWPSGGGYINTANAHAIGVRYRPPSSYDSYFDGYMADVNFIDGQALTADDFGEINEDTGEWSPKKYSGTYGTNGFYLPFDGNANDSSGNGNNWTENNLASTDYMIDTPTNNFATYLQDFSLLTLSEGNLETFNTTVDWQSGLSSIGVSSGKWYAEYGVITVDGDRHFVGITPNPTFFGSNNNYLGQTTDSYGYYGRTGSKYTQPAGQVAYGASFTAGDIIGIALDMDAGTVTFYKNNVSQGVAFTGLTGTMFIGSSLRAELTSETGVINFGADSSFAGNKTRQGNTDANGIGDFYYTPPAGYLALCTDNLPAPAIEQPETQFNVVTYTGDGTTPQSITGVGFQPDLVWIKRRDSAADNTVLDVLRGDARLETNNTNAELGGNANVFGSFDSDGFTTGLSAQTGASGGTYVAWCWKAGGTAVTNTDGTITSQVSANVDAGFSIVEYTGSGSSGSTVGHGLGGAPDFVLMKSSSHVTNWLAYHSSTPSGYYYVSSTAGLQSASWFSSNTDTFTLNNTYGDANTSGRTYIAYCFHSVEGFSKFGTYTGNGSADGPFVYTGFRPAFVMIKRTDSAGNAWYIWDNELNPYNADGDNNLWANNNNAENTNDYAFDGLSDGFKIRATTTNLNASGGTYIYMAFAEHPFNYATGR